MNKRISFSFLILIIVSSLFFSTNSYAQEKENQVTAMYLGVDEMLGTFIFFTDKRRKLSFYGVEEGVEIDLRDEKNAEKKYLVTWVMKTIDFYNSNGDITSSQEARVITALKEQ